MQLPTIEISSTNISSNFPSLHLRLLRWLTTVVYRKCENLNFFAINILITNKKNPIQDRLGSSRGTKREDRAQLGGLGTNSKRVFYGKLTCTTAPKMRVSMGGVPLTVDG